MKKIQTTARIIACIKNEKRIFFSASTKQRGVQGSHRRTEQEPGQALRRTRRLNRTRNRTRTPYISHSSHNDPALTF